MADDVLDRLSLEISSNANSSINAIKSLSKSLMNLKESIKGLENIKTDGLKNVADSLKSLNNINTKDSGINNTINALNRLLKTDIKGFKPDGFAKMTNAIKSLAGLPDVSKSVNRLVSSIARMSTAGEKTKEASTNISQLGDVLKKIVKDFSGIGGISESVSSFIESISKLAATSNKAGPSAAGLGELAKGLKMLFEELKDVPDTKESVVRMVEALAELQKYGGRINKTASEASGSFNKMGEAANNVSGYIEKAFGGIRKILEKSIASIKKVGKAFSSLYGIVKKVASAIKSAFGSLTKLAAKASSAITSSVKGISSAFAKLSGSSSGLKTASFGLKDLLKTALGFKAVSGLVDFGKSAIDLGSDITEVENVVDTAFGSMAQKAYDFASTASEQFGLSELAAKQYSGTMMAMLKSSGVAQEAAADMSIELAGLAGDLASFYNLDTDEAFYKLRSAIAGETEPMKALGVNMNIVNLEAFAMSQGITKAYKEMTLAEQTILRYNYILAKTGDAQGDFAKTAGTWANQIRLLKLNLQSISAIIGQGLIAAILPAIKWLNRLMAKLTQAAKVFRDFMYVLTGKKIETTPKGIVDDTAGMIDTSTDLSSIGDSGEEAAEGVEDAADSMDEATGSAKKLKKALSVLPIDQLNQLTGNLDDLDSSSKKDKKDKDKDLDDLGLGDMSDLFDDAFDKQEIQPVNEWARRLREAFLAGDWEELGKTIAEMLNKGLQKVYKVIKDITPKVEKALRNFAKVFNSFVKWFDWDLLGRTIGAGINLLARSFNALFGPGGINLEQLGRKLSVGLRGMIDEVDWRRLGNAIGSGFMIAWRIASGFVEDMWRINPDTLLTGWAETGIALAEAVQGIFERINFAQIGKTLSDGFNGIVETIRNFRNQMASNQTWSMIAKNISDGLNNLFEIDLSGMAHQISGLALDILRMLNDAAEMTHWEDFGYKIAEALASIPWRDLFDQVFYLVAATFGRALGGFVNYLTTHAEQLGQDFASMFNGIFDKIKYITENIPWDDIGIAISTFLNTSISNIDLVEAATNLGNLVSNLLGTMLYVAQETDWNLLGQKIGDFLTAIPWATYIGQMFDIVTAVFGGLITGLGGKILEKFPSVGTALAEGFNHAFETLKTFVDNMDGRWTEIGSTIATGLNNMIHGIDWKTAGETFGKLIKGVVDTIFTVAQETDWEGFGRGIGEFLDGIPWLEILGKVAATLKTVISGVLDGLKETTAGKVLAGLITIWLKLQQFKLVEKVKDLITKVGQAFGLLPKQITDTAPGVSGGVTQIGGLFGKLLPAASGLISKIGPILGKLATVIFSPKGAIIAAIVAAVALIILNWDKIKEAAGKLKDWIAEKWEGIKEKTSEIWGNVKEFLGNTWENLKENAVTVFGNIKDSIAEKFESIKETAANVWETVSSGLGNIWESLKTKAGDIWAKITGKVSDENKNAEESVSTSWGNTQMNLDGSLQAMRGSVETVMNSIKVLVGATMSEITTIYTSQWTVIAGSSMGAMNQLQTQVLTMMQTIKATISISMQEIGAIFNSGWQSASIVSSIAMEQIRGSVVTGMTAVQTAVSIIMQQIAGTFQTSWEAIGTMSFMAMERMAQDVTNKMSGINEAVYLNMNSIHATFETRWGDIEGITTRTMDNMDTGVTTKMGSIERTVDSVMKNVHSSFKKWEDISKKCDESLKNIESSVKTNMDSAKRTVETVMGDIQKAFEKWKDMSVICSEALKETKRTVETQMPHIKTAVSNSTDSIVTAYKNALGKMPTETTTILDRVVEIFRGLPSRISSAFDGLYRSGQNAAQSFVNGFKSIHIPTPQMYISRWKTHQIGNGKTMQTPVFSVEYLARGGLVNGLTPAILGENFKKEAVLPLENPRSMRMIAESIMAEAPTGSMKDDIKQAVMEGIVNVAMNHSMGNSEPQAPIYITVQLENDEAIARAAIRGQKQLDYRMNPTPQFG